jgi:hypothetical protein
VTYRAFIGFWNDDDEPDWIILDVRGLSWDAARNLIANKLRARENDECDICRSQASQELTRLRSSEPGLFEADVEGDDYIIMPEAAK